MSSLSAGLRVRLMARSEQLRQLAVLWKTWSVTVCSPFWRRPLGSLRQSQPRSRLCLPRFCGLGPARVSPLPKAAPGRSRGSVLLSQRGPTSVKSCSAAPPDCSVSTHRRSGSPASAAGRVRASERGRCGPRLRPIRASRRGC